MRPRAARIIQAAVRRWLPRKRKKNANAWADRFTAEVKARVERYMNSPEGLAEFEAWMQPVLQRQRRARRHRRFVERMEKRLACRK